MFQRWWLLNSKHEGEWWVSPSIISYGYYMRTNNKIYRPHEVIILLTPSPWRTVCLALQWQLCRKNKIHIISIQSHTARIYVCPPMSFTIISSQMITLCMCSRSIIGSMQCISNSLAAGSNPDPDAEVGTAGGRLVRVKMARKRRWRDIIVASLCTSKCMCTVYMKIQIFDIV